MLYVMIKMVLTKIIWNKKIDFGFLNTDFGILATLIDPKESARFVLNFNMHEIRPHQYNNLMTRH
mgnify:CR=1 FL=1